MSEVGRTQDVGYEVGVSKTFDATLDRVWQHLVSPAGFGTWVGAGARLPSGRGEQYQADDGTTGELRSLHTGDRIRATCRPPGWTHDTTIQLTVRPAAGDRTTVRLHQEWLADAHEREQQREHWRAVMARLEQDLSIPTTE
ncbi:SRPBCC family protein [Labedaea rhizosphaerae]|uniref:Activator of Hsp90 ATPase-like protein n=1 Tax=Labedaea rhizosphaerae TaxID=598644 RepID=A0A4V3CZF4_LABRH|nr:SRPBCC domain-containing protein [Labedaea rhizosphaerae]TDP97858.1 activator of Hsp90 ATPase-like protein [Labedaea rhizosphaerae]